MGENSAISWTHHTFNPWMGCTKVSPGCTNCYAERDMDHRWGKVKWGKGSPRVRTSAANWAKPLAWDRACAKAGRRDRVFCASLADVFDPEVPVEWLADLLALIDATPNLDWLLLTKRPELIRHRCNLASNGNGDCWNFAKHMPSVWLGTTVEDQQRANERIPHLLSVPARVRFLSCEPLLGRVSFRWALWHDYKAQWERRESLGHLDGLRSIDWVIAGGESGPQARPMHPEWLTTLRDECAEVGVPFHFKQWGEWVPQLGAITLSDNPEVSRYQWASWWEGAWEFFDRPDCWTVMSEPEDCMVKVGTKVAGRSLDGRTWDGLPACAVTA